MSNRTGRKNFDPEFCGTPRLHIINSITGTRSCDVLTGAFTDLCDCNLRGVAAVHLEAPRKIFRNFILSIRSKN